MENLEKQYNETKDFELYYGKIHEKMDTLLQLKEIGKANIKGEVHTIFSSPVFILNSNKNPFTLHRFVLDGDDYSAIYDGEKEIGSTHREREYDMILYYIAETTTY